jgi:epoxide hydrolase-like predicted phosphatase
VTIKAVLFDFGGVLVRTRDQESRRNWERTLGLEEGQLSRLVFESEATRRATIGALPERAIWEHVAETLMLDNDRLQQLKIDFWKSDQVDTQLVQFLRSLRPKYRTGILSNAWSNARQLFIETYQLGDVVDEMILSAEIGLAKPDTHIYLVAAQKLGVEPEEAIFVDDMPENVTGAIKAGMLGIQFTGTPELLETLSHLV